MGLQIVEVDSSHPLEDVLLAVRSIVWQKLVQAANQVS